LRRKTPRTTQLPNGKLLADVPGNPRPINNLPTAVFHFTRRPFCRAAHSGFGSYTSGEKQSLSVLNLETDELTDWPDDRLGSKLVKRISWGWPSSLDGKTRFCFHGFAHRSTGPSRKIATGNGIAVYAFENGRITPERFMALAPRDKIPGEKSPSGIARRYVSRRPEHW